MPEFLRKIAAPALIVVSLFLLFWRLDGVPLWRDEGTTANWGRLMAESGVWLPRTFDGSQLIVQGSDGHDINSRLLPAMQSWLQFYVAGVGFELLGVSTLTARLPFALLGLLTLWLLYRLGKEIFGSRLEALTLPALAVFSIQFLTAARQCRYYIIVVLAATLLLIEFVRYLKDPGLARSKSFYLRIGLYGIVLYLSNYLSFAGAWAALGLFVLLQSDRALFLGFAATSTALASVLGVEFILLHSEFVASWPPPDSVPLIDEYRSSLASRGQDFWRWTPLLFWLPAGWWVSRGNQASARPGVSLLYAVGLLAVVAPIVLQFGSSEARGWPAGWFWLYAVVCLAVPAAMAMLYRQAGERGILAQAALLAALMLVVSPLFTIAVGRTGGYSRHYYQTVVATVMLSGIAAVALARQKRGRAAAIVFSGCLIWPNLDFNLNSFDQVVERQFLKDASYSQPLLDYLRAHLQPSDRIAYFRNVKGMTAYFYLPEYRWVEILESEAPHNQQYRGRIPDDQFDDSGAADWYVVWDPRGGHPKGLNDGFEKVWEYEYPYRRAFWDTGRPGSTRKYEVFHRRPGAAGESLEPIR